MNGSLSYFGEEARPFFVRNPVIASAMRWYYRVSTVVVFCLLFANSGEISRNWLLSTAIKTFLFFLLSQLFFSISHGLFETHKVFTGLAKRVPSAGILSPLLAYQRANDLMSPQSVAVRTLFHCGFIVCHAVASLAVIAVVLYGAYSAGFFRVDLTFPVAEVGTDYFGDAVRIGLFTVCVLPLIGVVHVIAAYVVLLIAWSMRDKEIY